MSKRESFAKARREKQRGERRVSEQAVQTPEYESELPSAQKEKVWINSRFFVMKNRFSGCWFRLLVFPAFLRILITDTSNIFSPIYRALLTTTLIYNGGHQDPKSRPFQTHGPSLWEESASGWFQGCWEIKGKNSRVCQWGVVLLQCPQKKIVRTNRCQTHLNRLFLSTTSPQQLRQNRLLTRLRRRRPRLCPDEFRRPSVMTQCNSCEGVGVDQTLPSTISAKTLVPHPNRLRSFGVWRTLKTCLCGRLCCSRCLYHDDQCGNQW